ncbi:MAG TPA: AAA family ATPase [Polyangiaceae bacterium]
MRARLDAATPERPVSLGRYDVVGPLGRGGMGAVYDAVDRQRGARVALKAWLTADAGSGVQIKREFRTVADLAHPNLAPVYELAFEEGLWFFAMERIDGTDLRRWGRGSTADRTSDAKASDRSPNRDLPTRPEGSEETPRESAPPPPSERAVASPPVRSMEDIRRAFAELTAGLSALHDAGLWHGDIKPGNVLVRSDDRVVVVDFGLARSVSEARRSRGPTSGTPSYMSPEQLVGGDVGPPSDWYAVGTMLYEVLTGRLPFGGSKGVSLVELYVKKTLQTPPSPRDLVGGVPSDLSHACMRLLSADPALRPTRRELLAVLAGEAGVPLAAHPEPDSAARAVFVGRERELRELGRAYEQAGAGRCRVAHVYGASGIGKSAMVGSFLRGVHDVAGAEVLRGRCYERESVPYKAFDGIVDELAMRLHEMGGAIDAVLPTWTGELAQAFPALAIVPAVQTQLSRVPAMDAKELRRRAWTALRHLLEVFGGAHPVVLWIDDLQWADADSAKLLESLVKDARQMPLLIVASYRPAEAVGNEALAGYFAVAQGLPEGGLVEIPVSGLSRADSERLARATLEALTGEAANEARARSVAHEAAGVPFFIEELARYVAKGHADGASRVSLEGAVAARLRALPAEQRALVEVVAVADKPTPQALVFRAAGLGAEALPSLLALRSSSMLRWTGPGADDLVSAYHDRIRESVVAALSADVKRERHLALGRALVARHDSDGSGSWVFDAVRHLAAAAPALTDPGERLAATKLHLQAGRVARKAAAFPLAFSCFEGGIALLTEDAWTAHYDLALALHAGAAEAAYLSADWGALDRRVAEVKGHGRTPMDQLLAWEVQIDALVGRHEYTAAVETGVEVLELLGVHLPRNPGQAEVASAFETALAALTRVGPEGLAALSDVDDPQVAAAMRVQVRVSAAAYFTRPMLLPILAANLVSTSVERGLGAATPYALALFGVVLNAAGMMPVSHAWGQLAVRLLDRWEDRSLEAATRHVVFNLVCPWMVPLRTILAPLRATFDIGRRIGDLEYASYAAHGYVHNAMYAGCPLAPLLEEALELGEQMRTLGQVNAAHVHAPFEQLLKCWTGNLPDPSRLNDATFDEDALLTQYTAEGSRSGLCVLRVTMGLARYHFGSAREASACLEIARGELDAVPSTWHVPICHQFAALAGCAAWSELSEEERAALRPKIEASLEALRVLAGHAPFNFAHRVSLIEGELRRIDGDASGALSRFVEAADQARAGAWGSDEALARELAFGCEATAGARRATLERARDGYAAWGAAAKVAQIEARLRALASTMEVQEPPAR